MNFVRSSNPVTLLALGFCTCLIMPIATSQESNRDGTAQVVSTVDTDVSSRSDSAESSRFKAEELLPVEQLILMLSNRIDPQGDAQESLVFLGRTPQRGWEAIGLADGEELRSHWRNVASRSLAAYIQSDFPDQDKERIRLAVELSINQFLRTYTELRSEFMELSDQKARLALLAGDVRYEQLRQLGREGLFTEKSLVGRVVHTVLSKQLHSQE